MKFDNYPRHPLIISFVFVPLKFCIIMTILPLTLKIILHLLNILLIIELPNIQKFLWENFVMLVSSNKILKSETKNKNKKINKNKLKSKLNIYQIKEQFEFIHLVIKRNWTKIFLLDKCYCNFI